MRKYTLIFMEQRVGASQLAPISGAEGIASFVAADDDASLTHIREHLVDRLKKCARAELFSVGIVTDSTTNTGTRFVDDSHTNPHFQDTYVRYNAATKAVDVDFESTMTGVLADLSVLRTSDPGAATR